MIISRTPLRISFVGGGSDLESYYSKSPGAVVTTAINKYIYINVNKKFDNKIRASYSVTEIVDHVNDLKHQLIRESLKETKLTSGIEVTSISDIPSSGTGLGSSSSYTVGVLNALKAHKGELASPKYLAETACEIEINKCKEPIGKQDQYIAAYGGFSYIRFNIDGSVDIEPIVCKAETKEKLQNNLLMLYTGIERSASKILATQNQNVKNEQNKRDTLKKMVDLTEIMVQALSKGNVNQVGELLDENWNLKKQLATGVSNPQIDEWYKKAKKLGAIGGKILGAGGGGFLLLYVPQRAQPAVIKGLSKLRNVPVKFEPWGSKIIFVED